MNIESNNKKVSRKFLLDTSLEYEELIYQVENTQYNPEKVEGTSIYITSLESSIRRKISQSYCEESVIIGLGRIFNKFIESGELEITVNSKPVNTICICGEKINSCKILGEYQVDLYKGVKGSIDNNKNNSISKFRIANICSKFRIANICSKFRIAELRSKYKNTMHNKYCIIDNKIVIDESYNWTKATNYNEEHINIYTPKNY